MTFPTGVPPQESQAVRQLCNKPVRQLAGRAGGEGEGATQRQEAELAGQLGLLQPESLADGGHREGGGAEPEEEEEVKDPEEEGVDGDKTAIGRGGERSNMFFSAIV